MRGVAYTALSVCATLLVLPSFSHAQDDVGYQAVSGDGHGYSVTCNENGFVLTSLYPTFRFIENGVASRVEDGIETIYLGKSCDAYTDTFGEGTWGWANAGYIAEFERFSIGFPRQELYCLNEALDRSFETVCRIP